MKMYEKNGVRVELDTVHADAFKQAGWKEVITPSEIAEAVTETVTAESAVSEESVSDLKLEEMTKEELLEYAAEIGVNASTRASKADIVNAIRKKR